ncbi:MAG: Na+/H+ antiporter subunit E [Trueperaceae bacterium]|nr:Na+/H+ antiporter subunit E [Trueperaceae bacterium]
MVLALVWAMAGGVITLGTLAFGFVVGMAVLHFVGPVLGDERYALRFVLAIGLLFFFLKELVLSSVRVAIDVIKPSLTMRPAVVSVPLALTSDAQITLLANLISLTPGTLSVDVSDDKSCLYVHAMYGEDAEALRRGIKADFEHRIAEVFR